MATQDAEFERIKNLYSPGSPEMKKAKKMFNSLSEDEAHALYEHFFSTWGSDTEAAAKVVTLVFDHWKTQHEGEDPGEELLPKIAEAMDELDMGVNLNIRRHEDPEGEEPDLEIHADIKGRIPEDMHNIVLDLLKETLSEKTDYLIKFLCILGMEWAEKHRGEGEHIVKDVFVPVMDFLGDRLGFRTISRIGSGSAREAERVREAVDRIMGENDGQKDAEE